jgi:hypothetical protein
VLALRTLATGLLILIVMFLALGAVLALVPALDCGTDPDEPCLGSKPWLSIASVTMCAYLGAGVYLAVKRIWAAATGRAVRYGRTLVVVAVSFGAFLIASLAYGATSP